MKLKAVLTLFAASVLFATSSFADHSLTNITGTKIELKAYDHAIAGSVNDYVIFGQKLDEGFASRLIVRKDGQNIETTFKKEGEVLGGTLTQTVGDRQVNTSIKFVELLKEEDIFVMSINDERVDVKVTYDAYENNHFINPTYSAVVDGEQFSFSMEEGEACHGFSIHLIFMILGAYSL